MFTKIVFKVRGFETRQMAPGEWKWREKLSSGVTIPYIDFKTFCNYHFSPKIFNSPRPPWLKTLLWNSYSPSPLSKKFLQDEDAGSSCQRHFADWRVSDSIKFFKSSCFVGWSASQRSVSPSKQSSLMRLPPVHTGTIIRRDYRRKYSWVFGPSKTWLSQE